MSRYKKSIIASIIVFIAIAVQMLRADDQSYLLPKGIRLSEECSKYYRLANRHNNGDKCIAYSDTMRQVALRNKDKYGEVVSWVVPCHYYADTLYDIKKMDASAKAMQKAALEGGFWLYYFRGYDIRITAHMKRGAYGKAFEVLNQMQQDSYDRRNYYGIWLSHKMMADIYDQLDNPTERSKSLLRAIEVWPYAKQQNVTPLYVHLAELERDPEKRYAELMKGKEMAKSRVDTIMLNNGLISYYAFVKDTANFNKMYEKHLLGKKRAAGFSDPATILYTAYYKLFNGDKEGAVNELVSHRKKLGDRYARYLARLYYSAGDYMEVYRWHLVDDSVHKAKQKYLMVHDLYKYDARFKNDSLINAMREKDAELRLAAAESERMDAENARLNAEKEKEKSEHDKAIAEAKRRDAELKLTLHETEQKRQQAEQARKLSQIQAANARNQAELQSKNTTVAILAGIFVLLVVVVFMLITYARKAGKDLHHIEELNSKLVKAREEAEKANKMKDLFIQNMSHEIRTPLNAIAGFSQMLTLPGFTLPDEDKMMYGSHITNNVKMLTMLVDDILNVSDIESGKFSIEKMNTNVHKLLESAMSVTQYRVPGGVEFRLNDTLPGDYTINTDGSRAQQVLVNFLTNACKNTEEGYIELKAEEGPTPDTVVFSVTDTGCGIPKDQAENIFERFKKLDAFKQGNGLGLNICRTISEALSGRVWLDTSYTDGARFCFEVPKS